ncbi:MAG TPA: hypothetical protein DCZ94_06450 [Lentisphaeria bacterium]|nr:MAG: hypothetical protein A2X48_10930 [Lentisphaerae bacterium GWF2_49_21]HBC86576.1 hypothetical protein [Lentisphaeria bacterium]
MILEVSGKKFDNPTEIKITEVIKLLGTGSDSFIILSKNETTYIQTIKPNESNFEIEYQNDSLENHYVTREPVSLEKALEIFTSYFRSSNDWLSSTEWKKLDLTKKTVKQQKPVLELKLKPKEKSGCLGVILLSLLLLCGTIMISIYKIS